MMTCLPKALPAKPRTALLVCGYAVVIAATVLSAQPCTRPTGSPIWRSRTRRAPRSAGSTSAPRTPRECADRPSTPRDVVLSPQAWRDLVRINDWVNNAIKPMTDLDHWGVVEKWSYPDDGYGDCEDYVLLKRRMLIAGRLAARGAADHGGARPEGRRPRGAHRQDRQGRLHPRQPEREHPAVVGHRLPLREAPVAVRPQCVGVARRSAARHRHRHRDAERTPNSNKELRVPGHVPTPPRPQTGFARGRLSPKSRPHLFGSPSSSIAASPHRWSSQIRATTAWLDEGDGGRESETPDTAP